MQGACSNQIVKCIVYSSDMEIGKNKLLEIEKEKNELGIKNFREEDIERYIVRHKYLSEEEIEYQYDTVHGI